MYSSTSTVKKFEYEYFYKFSERTIFKLEQLKVCRKNINEYVFSVFGMLRRRINIFTGFIGCSLLSKVHLVCKLVTSSESQMYSCTQRLF